MINGFSAHADHSELLDWSWHLQPAPEHTFIVHGEDRRVFCAGGVAGDRGRVRQRATCRNWGSASSYNLTRAEITPSSRPTLAKVSRAISRSWRTVRGGVHDADARLALRHGGEVDRHGEDAFLKEASAEILRQGRFAEHDRHDGRLG